MSNATSLLPLCSRLTRAVALAEEHAAAHPGAADPARARLLRMTRQRLNEAHRDAVSIVEQLNVRRLAWDRER